ncbi:MAG: cobalamin-dependent protein [Candidatus Tectomicrobia bacterium]|nr:cobalamin-dependent protein [Candidatus Tectomicrobia bacterium]
MRILLIATNRHQRWMTREEVRPLPLGLAYVAAYIDPDRHPLKVVDLMFADDYLAETEQAINDFQPQLVGISIRNLDNGSYVNPQSALPLTQAVIRKIRSVSHAVIVCGGPAFSILPEACFAYLEPDVGLSGDAAEVFSELADLFEDGAVTSGDLQALEALSGVVYRVGDEIKTAPQRAASGLTKPPRLEGLALDRYRQAGFGVGIITKLNWYASTVSSPADRGHDRIVRPISDIVDEVKRLKSQFNLDRFYFIDSAFNQPLDGAKALCRSLLDTGLKIKWNSNLRPQEYDRDLMALMVRSGCQMVLIGGVRVNHPGASDERERLQDLCALCRQEGLAYAITQGFGEPGETAETVQSKLAFLSEVADGGASAHVNLLAGNRLMPGTPLTQRALDEGVISPQDDLLMPVFYVAPEVREDLVDQLETAARSRPNWHVM